MKNEFKGLIQIDCYQVLCDGGVFCNKMHGRIGTLVFVPAFGWVFDADQQFYLESGVMLAIAAWLQALNGEVR